MLTGCGHAVIVNIRRYEPAREGRRIGEAFVPNAVGTRFIL